MHCTGKKRGKTNMNSRTSPMQNAVCYFKNENGKNKQKCLDIKVKQEL